jgi:hypothetical protein
MNRNLGMDMGLAFLLDKAPGEILDYGFAMESLSAYKNPRVKLNYLLKIKTTWSKEFFHHWIDNIETIPD